MHHHIKSQLTTTQLRELATSYQSALISLFLLYATLSSFARISHRGGSPIHTSGSFYALAINQSLAARRRFIHFLSYTVRSMRPLIPWHSGYIENFLRDDYDDNDDSDRVIRISDSGGWDSLFSSKAIYFSYFCHQSVDQQQQPDCSDAVVGTK